MQVSRRALLIGGAGLSALPAFTAVAAKHDARLATQISGSGSSRPCWRLTQFQPCPSPSCAEISCCGRKRSAARTSNSTCPRRSSHRFRLGSVSKIVTATMAAILASRGIVDLDAPIFPVHARPARTAPRHHVAPVAHASWRHPSLRAVPFETDRPRRRIMRRNYSGQRRDPRHLHQ